MGRVWTCDRARGTDRPSGCLYDEVPAFAHAGRERLLVHGFGFHPFPCGRTSVQKYHVFGLIAQYLEMIGVHCQSDVGKDMHQWIVSSGTTRFAHVYVAKFEA